MKAVILDFDQTIADTSILEPLRKSRNWSAVYQKIPSIKLYPGIDDLIEFSRSKGYSIAVVTTSPGKYCNLGLLHLDIKSDVVIGYHDTVKKKPFPDPIIAALSRVSANPGFSFGLGDHENDIHAYNAAGIKSVACLWGRTGQFSQCNPSYTISNPSQLIQFL